MAGTPVLPAGWQRPKGYSNGMRASGELLAIAGQIAWDEQEKIVSDSFVEQFERALANVVAVVQAAGGQATDLISLTVYVVDGDAYTGNLAEVGAAYRRVMGKHYPAMALLQIAGFVEPGAQIEIQGLAVLGNAQ